MATQTPNFNFDLRESADIFNPLSTNANFESLDTILKNLQETGGITTYTTTAAANLLKLSGTPKVNDTVFKFVAAGDANTWTGATGGVINNIVALDGKQVTIKGGNMYVAWVNSANAMVVVAWPTAVDAQTFDGKGPTEWASKAQLDTVNQTAANATQTAQAAQTVANNALKVAQAAGVKITEVFNRKLVEMNSGTYQFSQSINGYKMLIFEACDDISNSTGASGRGYCVIPYPCNTPTYIMPAGFSARSRSYVRPITAITDTSFSVGDARAGTSGTSSDWAVITKVYAVR